MSKVSIIVPVYNVESYLNQCVDSLREQTYHNIEIILVDDGSSDKCPMLCDEYATLDSRIKVVHKENGGLSDARNYGIDAATGEYLIFVDSDDYWDDDRALEKCMSICCALDADVTIFGFKKYFQDTKKSLTIKMNVTKEDCATLLSAERLLKDNVFTTSACNKLVKASFFKGPHGIRFVKNQLSEDIEYCASILLKTQKYAVVPENFYVYRQHRKNSISSNIDIKNITDISTIIKKYVNIAQGIEDPLPLQNYLALQYILWMTISNLLPYTKVKKELNDMKRLWWLTEFNWCPYVKKISKIRWLGFDLTRLLLGGYKKLNVSPGQNYFDYIDNTP